MLGLFQSLVGLGCVCLLGYLCGGYISVVPFVAFVYCCVRGCRWGFLYVVLWYLHVV